MAVYASVLEGTWSWPDPEDSLDADDERRLRPEELSKLVLKLERRLLGETVGVSTWQRTYVPFFQKLQQQASRRHWLIDHDLIEATLRNWAPNSRSRQSAELLHLLQESALLLAHPPRRCLHLDGGEHRHTAADVFGSDQQLPQPDQIAAPFAQAVGHQPAPLQPDALLQLLLAHASSSHWPRI